jgi:hypothetical protein
MNTKIIFLLALTSSAAIITMVLAKNHSTENAFTQVPTITVQAAVHATTGETQTLIQTHTMSTTVAPNTSKIAKKISGAVARRYEAISDNPQYPTIEERVVALEQLYPEKQIDPEKVVDALSQPLRGKSQRQREKNYSC